jgi:hypothetical protein
MGVDIRKMDMFKLEFQDRSFDLVYHQGVLEHFDDERIVAALSEQGRVGQWVVFHVPNRRYPTRPFGDERLLSNGHWKKLVRSAGLEVVRVVGDQPNPLFHFFIPHVFYTKSFKDLVMDVPSYMWCRSSIIIARPL